MKKRQDDSDEFEYIDEGDEEYEKIDIDENEIESISQADLKKEGITLQWPENYEKIGRDRLLELIEEFNNGDEETKKRINTIVVGSFQKLVGFSIRKWYRQFAPKYSQELYQEGCKAIMEKMCDYKKTVAPSTYFAAAIKHELQVYVAEEIFGTSRHYAAASTKIKKAEEKLSQIDGQSVHSDIVIAQMTGLSLTTIAETRRHMNANDHIEFDATNESSITESYPSPEEELFAGELSRAIADALTRLSDEERKIIIMLYGFDDGIQRNCNEVSRKLGTTVEKVRILAQDAQRKLALDANLAFYAGAKEKKKGKADVPFLSILRASAVDFFDYEKK